jgi:hypothetical protein
VAYYAVPFIIPGLLQKLALIMMPKFNGWLIIDAQTNAVPFIMMPFTSWHLL